MAGERSPQRFHEGRGRGWRPNLLNAGTIALYAALRVASWVLAYIPLRFAYAAASLVGNASYFLFPLPRRAVRDNLLVANPGLTERERKHLARSAFRTDAMNWTDTLRIPSLKPDEIVESIEIEGWHLIDEALSNGKGLILVTLHLGNFDLVGQVLAATAHQITVPVERMRPRRLFDLLARQRASQGIHIVSLERAPRELISALKRKEIVGVAGDRNLQGRGVVVEMFGRPTQMPRGPAALARHSGAPVLIGVGIRGGLGRYLGFVRGPIVMRRTESVEDDDRTNTQRIVAEFEPLIRRYPGQWLAFSRMWPHHSGSDSPATMSQQTGAAV